MAKTVKEVFSDYKNQSNILTAIIEKMNLKKKENILEIALQSERYLEIKEIWYFEKFLMERFQFSQVDIAIKYGENAEINEIIEEKISNSKWNIDTVGINKSILQQAGLKPQNIIDSQICSVCNKDLIHSFRVEKEGYGVETAVIGLI